MNERPTNTLPNDDDLIRLQNEFFSKKIVPAANILPTNNLKKEGKISDTNLSSSDSSHAIIGDIIERKTDKLSHLRQLHADVRNQSGETHGFPKPTRIKRNIPSKDNKSLFAMSRKQKLNENQEQQFACTLPKPNSSQQGYALEKSVDAEMIHKENVKKLENMDVNQILNEQKQLFQSLDPKIIQFLQSKRKETIQPTPANPISKDNTSKTCDSSNIESSSNTAPLVFDDNIRDWHNYNLNVKLEVEKLQWMTDIPNEMLKTNRDKSYEARFDWKGVLLPYSLTESDGNRELFLHGDDAQRPGYTIQELFRLARSNIIQQRNSAIFSIAGILNIYNQGFYDAVLELPISKIFFLLRFAFDDNAQSSLEVTSKALATLFYNDCDEFLLDYIYDCSNGCREPALNCWQKFADNDSDENSTQPKMFAYRTSLTAEDEDASNLNDFHLAETDLIKCTIRSNILQRINYIVATVRPDNSTITNCLKILIRIARTDKQSTESILNQSNLMNNLCEHFLPNFQNLLIESTTTTKFYNRPQFLLLKLIRIMTSYGVTICQHFDSIGTWETLKSYIFVNGKITIDMIHLQIEAMRLIKVITISTKCDNLYNELLPAFIFILEWCYQFLNIDKNSHPIFRQHATALISLIGHRNALCLNNLMTDKLKLCFSKWFHLAATYDSLELSQNILLAACIDTCSSLFGPTIYGFYENYLNKFVSSKCFLNACEMAGQLSPLLTNRLHSRTYSFAALPTVNSIVFDKTIPSYILSEKYSIFLLQSIANLLNTMNSHEHYSLHDEIFDKFYNNHLLTFIQSIADDETTKCFQTNWFVRSECSLLMAAIKCKKLKRKIDKIRMQQMTQNLCSCLTENQIEETLEIFDLILFDIEQYENPMNFNKNDLDNWKKIFINVCILMQRTTIASSAIMIKNHNKRLFCSNWMYSPLLPLFKTTECNEILSLSGITEKHLIDTTLSYALLRKANSMKTTIEPIDELQYLMISFLGQESAFLSADTHEIIMQNVVHFFALNQQTKFDFDRPDIDVTFENLFIALLEQFQASSYGNELFGAILMIPLAMKYNVKWRKMVWSEHASVLAFIRCTSNQLISGTVDDYLEPIECDADLLNSYVECLNTKMIRPNSLPYQIATHHLKHFKRKLV